MKVAEEILKELREQTKCLKELLKIFREMKTSAEMSQSSMMPLIMQIAARSGLNKEQIEQALKQMGIIKG